ncbi:M20/M25/M40 family metallo-hydrolase [Streptomyces luomodiensis]|uniref:M20/M25/M40 family metallo-hydrolase n=1 Tax=Streptomyces luomodiensis TaxID=3026192 RepID=A0ABY9V589_9ACTN|nr:M20/M25/M40 family metallo-hydrolase [Streptomyces sp. SCA4-21]WNF00033.1 M20/M25/M40 family metallo-hydrolase [Streptomyces sp. SCA4-21]
MNGRPEVSASEATELLRHIVEIPSPSYHEAALARYLVERLRSWGFTASVDPAGNVIGELDRGPGPTVLLLAHMDTAPGTPRVRCADGRLYGRGTVDAKGPLAAMVCAAVNAHSFRGRLRLVAAVEEETPGSRGATEYVRRGHRPDALIVGEPSGVDTVVLGYKGRLDLRYDVRCPAAHPTSPEPRATELAVLAWRSLLEMLGPASHFAFDRPGVTLTELSGDLTTASAHLTVRTPPGFDADACAGELRQRVGRGEVSVVHAVPACRVRRTDPVVRALTRAIRGQDLLPRAKVKTATSDMNTVAEYWEVPMATYGPGDSRLDHTEDEHIVLVEYHRSIAVLAEALTALPASLPAMPRPAPGAQGPGRAWAATQGRLS